MSEQHLLEPFCFLGAKVHPWSSGQTLSEINRRLNKNLFTQHAVVNAAKVINMHKDPMLREAVNSCDIVNADGMGVVWGARILGHDIQERVAGVDLFFRLLELAVETKECVFFLGAEQNVLEKAVLNIRKEYPGLKIAGWHHGYFWDDEESVVRLISSSNAGLLFVAITSPKKEQFIHRWREQLCVKFAMGVGGTFDIVAGMTNRAPKWMQKFGLEWLYRVIQEPDRMWKRYLSTNTLFVCYVIKEWVQMRLSVKK